MIPGPPSMGGAGLLILLAIVYWFRGQACSGARQVLRKKHQRVPEGPRRILTTTSYASCVQGSPLSTKTGRLTDVHTPQLSA